MILSLMIALSFLLPACNNTGSSGDPGENRAIDSIQVFEFTRDTEGLHAHLTGALDEFTDDGWTILEGVKVDSSVTGGVKTFDITELPAYVTIPVVGNFILISEDTLFYLIGRYKEVYQ